jgi:hypothetical protein
LRGRVTLRLPALGEPISRATPADNEGAGPCPATPPKAEPLESIFGFQRPTAKGDPCVGRISFCVIRRFLSAARCRRTTQGPIALRAR